MEAVYLDTHVVAWLFAGRLDLLPPAAIRRLEDGRLLISPMVELELQYLFEVGKTADPARTVVHSLARSVDLRTCDLPFPEVAAAALDLAWTRDPFDRLIAAQARLREADLMTRDRSLRTHYPRAVWD